VQTCTYGYIHDRQVANTIKREPHDLIKYRNYPGYTELLEDARKEATDRMIADAQSKGANAIVNVRFSTSAITSGASELYVYGTGVVVSA